MFTLTPSDHSLHALNQHCSSLLKQPEKDWFSSPKLLSINKQAGTDDTFKKPVQMLHEPEVLATSKK